MQRIIPTAAAANDASNVSDDKWIARKRKILALKRVLIAKAEVRRLQSLLGRRHVIASR